MYSIIIVIISIGLFASFLSAGLSYVNIERFYEMRDENMIKSSLASFSVNFSAYENLKGYPIETINWKTELSTINKNLPDSLETSTWSYVNNSNTYYFCLSSVTTTESIYNSMINIATDTPNNTFVNLNCGADENTTELTPPANHPSQVALTYWIRK
jgi:hypothetical protein